MKDEDAPDDEATQGPGKFAAAALRITDAGLRALQKLRDRLEPPAADDDSARDRNRADGGENDEPAVAPPRKTLLHRTLIVLMCLLLGATAGGLLAYRTFSKMLESHALLIENLQLELVELRKVEERGLDARAKYRAELNDYRKQLRETQFELAASEKRGEDLKRQLDAMKRAASPPAPAATAAASRTARPRTPQKTGTCIARPDDPPGKLQECLDKFNQP